MSAGGLDTGQVAIGVGNRCHGSAPTSSRGRSEPSGPWPSNPFESCCAGNLADLWISLSTEFFQCVCGDLPWESWPWKVHRYFRRGTTHQQVLVSSCGLARFCIEANLWIVRWMIKFYDDNDERTWDLDLMKSGIRAPSQGNQKLSSLEIVRFLGRLKASKLSVHWKCWDKI